MISVHRLNGTEFWLNAELIEQIDSAPDTVITLTTGNNIIVTEPVGEVVDKILRYRANISRTASERPRVGSKR
jgi:flagellar protein FlbD